MVKCAAKSTPTTKSNKTVPAAKVVQTPEEKALVKEKATAKEFGLSLTLYRILKALHAAKDKGLTYREIEAKTGYYASLTANLRKESNRGGVHADSLGTLGLVKEVQYEDEPLRFIITAKGNKKFETKTAAPKAAQSVKAAS